MAPRYGNPKQYSGSLFTAIKHILSRAPSPRTRAARRGWPDSSHLRPPPSGQSPQLRWPGRGMRPADVHTGRGHWGVFVLFVVIVVSSLSPACLRVYAPLPAGLSKCSSLTQNRSTLSPAAVAKPENWGWGRCRGERRKRNRDTFSLASLSSSAPHATTPPQVP